MDLSVREAATLLGRSPRTLRGQLARGEIPGRKRGGRWVIPRHELPLNERQRRVLQERGDAMRTALEDALPAAARRNRTGHSVADLETFRLGLALWRDLRAAPTAPRAALDQIHEALIALCRGKHAYERSTKAALFRETRDRLAACVARLLLDGGGADTTWAARIEGELLPSLAGLIRWAEERRNGRP